MESMKCLRSAACSPSAGDWGRQDIVRQTRSSAACAHCSGTFGPPSAGRTRFRVRHGGGGRASLAVRAERVQRSIVVEPAAPSSPTVPHPPVQSAGGGRTARLRLGRLMRKMLFFSKCDRMHEICLRLFLHRYNLATFTLALLIPTEPIPRNLSCSLSAPFSSPKRGPAPTKDHENAAAMKQ